MKKLKVVKSLVWAELRKDAGNIVHTFVSTGYTSRIDWGTVFESAGYSDSRILILDRADLKAFFGPMLDICVSHVVSMISRGKLDAICCTGGSI